LKLIVKMSSFWSTGRLWKTAEGKYLFCEQVGKDSYRQELSQKDNIPAIMGLRSNKNNCTPHFSIVNSEEAKKIGF